jgi:hypothetical protein
MPKTKSKLKPIRNDICFCLGYFKVKQPPAVYVSQTYETYYLNFSLRKIILFETYFKLDLENTLLHALRKLKAHEE